MQKKEERQAQPFTFEGARRFDGLPLASRPQKKEVPLGGKLAVLFPGTGYSCERPLLYYARRAAEQIGCDVLPINYHVFLKRESGDLQRQVQNALPQALQQAEMIIKAALCRKTYRELFFFGKSFGTVVAGELEQKLTHQKIHQFFLTPLASTLPYMGRHVCFAASGTADPWVTDAVRQEMKRLATVQMYLFPGANHSLEVPENVAASVQNMQFLLDAYQAFLCRKSI
ncbi:MAG: hypothetical protein LKE53_06550 [Oscillospiraceae bacterium]|jgi:hypothetical protein|nr:hypothetical protein [Oscillospiraceae bacterium]